MTSLEDIREVMAQECRRAGVRRVRGVWRRPALQTIPPDWLAEPALDRGHRGREKVRSRQPRRR